MYNSSKNLNTLTFRLNEPARTSLAGPLKRKNCNRNVSHAITMGQGAEFVFIKNAEEVGREARNKLLRATSLFSSGPAESTRAKKTYPRDLWE
jgi:hypothetical protein